MAYMLIEDSPAIGPLEPVQKTTPARHPARWLMLLAASIAIVCAWLASASRVVELGGDPRLFHDQVAAHWQSGDVLLLIRHAERCDRSGHICAGEPTGITVKGSDAAAQVGEGLRKLGLSRAQTVSSEAVRTRQTAEAIAGHKVPTADWASECDRDFSRAAVAHKHPGENLVVVTHSGCIDHFEREAGIAGGGRSSEFTEAVFVAVDGVHPARILGSVASAQWQSLAQEPQR
ncbi:lipopolysaccharide core heptose(II)-phosphate phosphatase PmrG [Pseudomonas sp. TMB3-21]